MRSNSASEVHRSHVDGPVAELGYDIGLTKSLNGSRTSRKGKASEPRSWHPLAMSRILLAFTPSGELLKAPPDQRTGAEDEMGKGSKGTVL